MFGPSTYTFADLDNSGTSFVIGFTPNYPGYYGENVDLHITSDTATEATINYPAISPIFTTTVPVTPGSVTIVNLPVLAQSGWVVDTVQDNAVEITALDEVVVYMINRAPATSDAALALPVDTLNTEYIISTYDETYVAASFVVVAAYDNTEVTIIPSNATKGGHLAGVPYTVLLSKGSGMLVQENSNGATGGLTGTIVSSSKPVQVTNGNGCTNVPNNYGACDTLMEVAQPVQSWGTEAILVNLPNRPSGSIYRVVASEDNTTVKLDGVTLGVINRGKYLDTPVIPDSHVMIGDKPIFVTQYMTGQSYPGAINGDPAMGNVIPSAQYRNHYTFSTVGGGQFAEHFLTLIVNNSDVGTLSLDGIAVAVGEYSPIPGTNFSSAVVRLSEGTHTTFSVNPHGVTVEGYGNYDSYIYPGGALFRFINPVGDPFAPVCSVTITNTENGILFTGSAKELVPTEDINGNKILDPGEDLNGNGVIDRDTGVFLIEMLPGSANITFTPDVFVPGASVVNFTAQVVNPALIGTGTVRVTDGVGNTCEAILATPIDCLGVPSGTAKLDICGVCNGDGTSCAQQCSTVAASSSSAKKGNSVLSTARLLVKRTQKFSTRARECGLSAQLTTKAVRSAQNIYNSLKQNVVKTYTGAQLKCANSLCAQASTTQTNKRLSTLTNRLYRVQKQTKLNAIRECGVQEQHKPDTRKRTEGYRDDVISAINQLPKAVTRCTN